jgi:hypothetical protein
MDGLTRIGRLLYAVAIVFFGLQCIASGSGRGPVPAAGPPWVQTQRGLALLFGCALIVAGMCLVVRWYGRATANILGVGILLRGLVIYLPTLLASPRDPRPWTSLFELTAMGGAALVIAGTFPSEAALQRRDSQWLLVEAGRWLFAVSLVVFGVQHLMYSKFVAALIPAWIPGHLFWTYSTGIAFLLVAASLISKVQVRLSAGLLGLMFLLWVILLHIPRVAKARGFSGNEWTSEFVALAMCGASFVLSEALQKRWKSSMRSNGKS